MTQEGDDLLGRLFKESQESAMSKDVASSAAYATAAGELITAFANVRRALLDAASAAGLGNVTFTPDDDFANAVEPKTDDNGTAFPTIEFALTARNEGAQLSLVIRGMVARTYPSTFNPAIYIHSPLTISLLVSGRERTREWQPMATDILEQGDESAVARVDNSYFVNGQRLAMVIAELHRGS